MTFDELMAMRINKKRPHSMIIISMLGDLKFNNPTINIKRPYDYDFRPLIDLDVQIIHKGNLKIEDTNMFHALHYYGRPRSLSIYGPNGVLVIAENNQPCYRWSE